MQYHGSHLKCTQAHAGHAQPVHSRSSCTIWRAIKAGSVPPGRADAALQYSRRGYGALRLRPFHLPQANTICQVGCVPWLHDSQATGLAWQGIVAEANEAENKAGHEGAERMIKCELRRTSLVKVDRENRRQEADDGMLAAEKAAADAGASCRAARLHHDHSLLARRLQHWEAPQLSLRSATQGWTALQWQHRGGSSFFLGALPA